jgi:hypothetical protein
VRSEHRSQGPLLAYTAYKVRMIGSRLHAFCTQASGHGHTQSSHAEKATLGWNAVQIWNSILG